MPKVKFGTERFPNEVDTDAEELSFFDTPDAVLLCEKMLAGEFARLKKLSWVSFVNFFRMFVARNLC